MTTNSAAQMETQRHLYVVSAMVSNKGYKRGKKYGNQSSPGLHSKHESAAVIEALNAEQTARHDITRMEMRCKQEAAVVSEFYCTQETNDDHWKYTTK